MDLIDGGVLNPVPIAPTFSDETDYTIAVNLGGKVEIIKQERVETKQTSPEEDESFTDKINKEASEIASYINIFCYLHATISIISVVTSY